MLEKGLLSQRNREQRTLWCSKVRATIPIALWFVATGAIGATWIFRPSASIGVGYETNAELVAEDPIDTSRYEVKAHAQGGRLTERSEIAFSLKAFSKRYSEYERLNSDNLSAAIASTYQLNELDVITLGGSYERDTSRTSELTTTGNIQGNVLRNTYTLQSSWTRPLTDLSAVGIAYAYTNVRYEDNQTGLINYDQHILDTSYNRQLTERASFKGTLAATFYNPEDPVSYNGYQATLGFSYAIAETLTGDIFYGPQQIDSETDIGPNAVRRTTRGSTYGIHLAKEFERGGLDLELNRGAVPSGAGEPLLQESLEVGLKFQVSPTLKLVLPAAVYRNETLNLGDSEQRERRIYFSSNPALIWRVSDDFVLGASYRYQYQRFEDSGESAASNAIFLSLQFTGAVRNY